MPPETFGGKPNYAGGTLSAARLIGFGSPMEDEQRSREQRISGAGKALADLSTPIYGLFTLAISANEQSP